MKRKRSRDKSGMTVEQISCSSKIKHPTEVMARMFAKRVLFRKPKSQRAMWVYACEFCDGWHICSRPSGYPAVTRD